jgi:hypothetical protein
MSQDQNMSIATREYSTPRTQPNPSLEGTRYSRHLSTPSARLDIIVMESLTSWAYPRYEASYKVSKHKRAYNERSLTDRRKHYIETPFLM